MNELKEWEEGPIRIESPAVLILEMDYIHLLSFQERAKMKLTQLKAELIKPGLDLTLPISMRMKNTLDTLEWLLGV